MRQCSKAETVIIFSRLVVPLLVNFEELSDW